MPPSKLVSALEAAMGVHLRAQSGILGPFLDNRASGLALNGMILSEESTMERPAV